MKRIAFHAASAALLLLAAACGSDKSTGPGNGGNGGNGGGNGGTSSFNVTITGDLEGAFAGTAHFASLNDPDMGQAFQLVMHESNGGTGQIILAASGARPGNGSYNVVDIYNGGDVNQGEFMAIALDGDPNDPSGIFFSTGGSVTISSSSSGTVKGSFQFDAIGFINDDPTELGITMSGTFTAKAGAPATVTSLKIERHR